MASKLLPIVFRAPGIGGLNLEGEAVGRDPSTARVAENVVYDEAGRLCSRKGFNKLTTSPLSGTPPITAMHMMDTSSGNKLIAATSGKLWESAPSYTSFTDVTGSLTPSTDTWQFVNFNDKVIGACLGESLIVKSYAGNFAGISAASGTVPDGNCIHSAFGRLWAQKGDSSTDKTIIAYSALLDETHWSTGAGTINVLGTAGAVAHGYDELVAISSFDNYLIAFLRNSIVIYNNPDDPSNLGIEKVIQGVGCIARDSVQQTGDDIIFMSATGLRSFRHTVQSENNLELGDMSRQVRRSLVSSVSQVAGDAVKSVFFPEDALYMLLAGNTVWALDLHKETLQAGETRITKFPNSTWDCFSYHEGNVYIGLDGVVGTYANYLDDAEPYNMKWYSTYADFDSTKLKMLKKITMILLARSNQPVTFEWFTDYGDSYGTTTKTTAGAGTTAEWGVAEWGIDEWSGTTSLSKITGNANRSGQTVSFGFNITVDNAQVCIEQMSLLMTLGREAR